MEYRGRGVPVASEGWYYCVYRYIPYIIVYVIIQYKLYLLYR